MSGHSLVRRRRANTPLIAKAIAVRNVWLHAHMSFVLFLLTILDKNTLRTKSTNREILLLRGGSFSWEPWGHNLPFAQLVYSRTR